ncbi:A/G-specific adenine glycosylase [Schleiferilactobacillus perolens]|jgi:A/G-specific adenine glycosylase|uniref:A/G-specific adenine glycosylase n=1 Tax=Schleiferilactobacillus perolens TaxID=100468 RepID=UPI0023564181|nr:A/G-specific adenine glycosylase [Schleiferilactobacillus perolens]MCI2170820.1 A/G-specific adenine glycosylase [Schleiferilactobacillus perolens]
MEHWDEKKICTFQQTLLNWYDEKGRDLPWRRDQDPYHVWLSEVMLQQTGVQTVMPYYEKWLARFPTVTDLAAADEDTVLHQWAGLGYYSRARNLLKTAQIITNERNGEWPKTVAGLKALPGIGEYVAGAVASIAFGVPTPAIDGNAYRVFSRLLLIDTDITSSQARKVFAAAITPLIPLDRPGDFNQAVMDLGSSYMKAKDPDSAHSPVKEFDAAYRLGITAQYPVRSPRKKAVAKTYTAIVLRINEQVVWQQRPNRGLLASLWTWPLLAGDQREVTVPDLVALLATDRKIAISPTTVLRSQVIGGDASVDHVFTHQHWTVYVRALTLSEPPVLPASAQLLPLTQQKLALPTLQKKISQFYNQER